MKYGFKGNPEDGEVYGEDLYEWDETESCACCKYSTRKKSH